MENDQNIKSIEKPIKNESTEIINELENQGCAKFIDSELMKTSYANIFIKSDSNYKSVLDESKNITSKVDENYSSSQKLEKLLVGRKIS